MGYEHILCGTNYTNYLRMANSSQERSTKSGHEHPLILKLASDVVLLVHMDD